MCPASRIPAPAPGLPRKRPASVSGDARVPAVPGRLVAMAARVLPETHCGKAEREGQEAGARLHRATPENGGQHPQRDPAPTPVPRPPRATLPRVTVTSQGTVAGAHVLGCRSFGTSMGHGGEQEETRPKAPQAQVDGGPKRSAPCSRIPGHPTQGRGTLRAGVLTLLMFHIASLRRLTTKIQEIQTHVTTPASQRT